MESDATRESQRLGDRLRRARIAVGMTQEELAHLIDMHASNIGRIERGDANPSLSTMSRIARALGADLGELLSGIPGHPD